jgi:hypothetical protein
VHGGGAYVNSSGTGRAREAGHANPICIVVWQAEAGLEGKATISL